MTRSFLLLLFVSGTLSGCMGGTATLSPSQQKLVDLQQRAQLQASRGQQSDAARLLQEALTLSSSLDDRHGQASVLIQQARLARQSGDLETADRAISQALSLACGSQYYADAAQERALQELVRNHLETATQWAETARREEHGDLIGSRINLLARLALLQGDHQRAALLAEEALRNIHAEQLPAERANALRLLGVAKARQGQHDQAEQILQQALTLDKQLELPPRIAADLEALAELAGQRGDTAAQKQYLQRSATVRSAIGR